jgi:ribosomal-protein-alanine N-acetyltransferase
VVTLATEPGATGDFAGGLAPPVHGWRTGLSRTAAGVVPAASIRRAGLTDIPRLKQLEDASFATDRLSRRAIRLAVNSHSQRVLVALDVTDEVVGAAFLHYRRGSRLCRVYSIAVTADHRCDGLGSQLLTACEREAKRAHRGEMRLEARADDPAALRFYERNFYRRAGVRAGFYEDGGDAICFTKSLTGPSTRR